MMDPHHAVHDSSELLSPSLLIYPQLVRQNIQEMIALAGGAARLRPHIKTHKMAEIVRLAESLGIRKHKCATIAEAEMAAAAGANRRAAGLSAHRSQPQAVRPSGARLSLDDLSRDRRSSRLGAGTFGRRRRARPRRFRFSSTSRSGWAGPGSNRATRPPSFMP